MNKMLPPASLTGIDNRDLGISLQKKWWDLQCYKVDIFHYVIRIICWFVEGTRYRHCITGLKSHIFLRGGSRSSNPAAHTNTGLCVCNKGTLAVYALQDRRWRPEETKHLRLIPHVVVYIVRRRARYAYEHFTVRPEVFCNTFQFRILALTGAFLPLTTISPAAERSPQTTFKKNPVPAHGKFR